LMLTPAEGRWLGTGPLWRRPQLPPIETCLPVGLRVQYRYRADVHVAQRAVLASSRRIWCMCLATWVQYLAACSACRIIFLLVRSVDLSEEEVGYVLRLLEHFSHHHVSRALTYMSTLDRWMEVEIKSGVLARGLSPVHACSV
jgi:hypothetical protein